MLSIFCNFLLKLKKYQLTLNYELSIAFNDRRVIPLLVSDAFSLNKGRRRGQRQICFRSDSLNSGILKQ